MNGMSGMTDRKKYMNTMIGYADDYMEQSYAMSEHKNIC
jgi:hypothetical protein